MAFRRLFHPGPGAGGRGPREEREGRSGRTYESKESGKLRQVSQLTLQVCGDGLSCRDTYSFLLGKVARGAEDNNDGVLLELDGARNPSACTLHLFAFAI